MCNEAVEAVPTVVVGELANPGYLARMARLPFWRAASEKVLGGLRSIGMSLIQ